MEILCKVDQAEALRRGIDAPSSTVKVQIVPAELTEPERQRLAQALDDGHDATAYKSGRGLGAIPSPDAAGLRERLAEVLAEEERTRRSEEERAARTTIESDAKAEAAILGAHTETVRVCLLDDGLVAEADVRAVVFEDVIVPAVNYIGSWWQDHLSPAMRERYVSARAEAQAGRERAIAEATADGSPLRLRWAEEMGRRAEAEAVRRAAWDALYQRLPETIRLRHSDGFASDKEIAMAMRRMIVGDLRAAGVTVDKCDADRYQEATRLTDEQYLAMRCWRQQLTDAGVSEVEIKAWAMLEERACGNHEAYDPDCDDCEAVEVGVEFNAAWEHASGISVSIARALRDE